MKAVVLLLIAIVCINARSLHHSTAKVTAHRALTRSQRDVEANACLGYSCVSNGGVCDDNTKVCSTSSYCKASGGGDTGICTASVADGGACTEGDACASEYSVCDNGVCTALTFSATVGQACGGLASCTSALYCNATDTTEGICVAVNTTGSACAQFGVCNGASFCDSTYNCVALFTTAIGGNCYDTVECVVGSYCTYVDPSANPGVCTAGVTSSNTACTSDSQCTSPQECGNCPLNTKGAATGTCVAPFVYTTANSADVSAYASCQTTANCASFYCYSACKSQICAYYHDFTAQWPSALSCFNGPADAVSNCGVDAAHTSDGACMNPSTMICAFAIAATMASL